MLEIYHRYPDNQTPVSVEADQVNAVVHVIVVPLAGADNTGVLGAVVSRYTDNEADHDSLTPVVKVTVSVFIPSDHVVSGWLYIVEEFTIHDDTQYVGMIPQVISNSVPGLLACRAKDALSFV